MESLIVTIALIFALVWAFRIEINTAKTAESLKRIEALLAKDKKEGK